MRRVVLLSFPLLFASVLLAVSCSRSAPPSGHGSAQAPQQVAGSAIATMPRVNASGGFAGFPDHGDLLGYTAPPLVRHESASNWYRADISETHALRAIVTGQMTVTAPDGAAIQLHYQRHIEHPNGNWTWIGRDARGEDAIITFGEMAVFGSIPREGREELRLSTLGGHSWIVEVIPGKQHYPRASKPDYLVPPKLASALTATSQTDSAVTSAAVVAAAATTTVDIALGYTTGFASELGGDSQAVTRLQNLVDITNQAYANSQIDAQIRMVRTISVSYSDATSNDDTLNKLTGSTGSSSTPVDPAFNGLRAARDQYGADLVVLVRRFRTPENDGCGIAWLLGGGQMRIDNFDAPFGYGVVSDDLDRGDFDEGDGKTYVCRKETLAHELGHNMGQTHNVEDDGNGGAHTYSYGYRETSTTGFYTVMAYRLPNSSQRAIRYFANPNVADAVTGRPTGVANVSDNARSMAQTMPIIATFRLTAVPVGVPDLYVIAKQGASLATEVHILSGASTYQSFSLHKATVLGRTGSGWKFHLGDYNGDGKQDLFSIKKMGASGKTEVHVLNGADQFQSYLLNVATALGQTGTDELWAFELGDYNADEKLDLYAIKRQGSYGRTEVHVLNGANKFQSFLAHVGTVLGSTGTDLAWRFELGDFNNDAKLDLYCIKKVAASGRTEVHILNGANEFQGFLLHAATALGQTGTDNAWDFKLGDFNHDFRPDIYAIKKQGSSGKTEVHVLSGTDAFQTFLLHKATALGATGSDGSWDFDLSGD